MEWEEKTKENSGELMYAEAAKVGEQVHNIGADSSEWSSRIWTTMQ
jgi:hypothetical protein